MRRNRIPILLPNGNLLVRTAFDADCVTGDGLTEVKPGTADYEEWVRWMQENNVTPIPSEKEAPVLVP